MLLQEKGEPEVAYQFRIRTVEDDRIVAMALAAMAYGPVAAVVVITDQTARTAAP
jgi:hypothetical protein